MAFRVRVDIHSACDSSDSNEYPNRNGGIARRIDHLSQKIQVSCVKFAHSLRSDACAETAKRASQLCGLQIHHRFPEATPAWHTNSQGRAGLTQKGPRWEQIIVESISKLRQVSIIGIVDPLPYAHSKSSLVHVDTFDPSYN